MKGVGKEEVTKVGRKKRKKKKGEERFDTSWWLYSSPGQEPTSQPGCSTGERRFESGLAQAEEILCWNEVRGGSILWLMLGKKEG